MFRFAVVDDEIPAVALLRKLVGDLDIGDREIWPTTNRVFTSWDVVWNELLQLEHAGWTPTNDCCVLILDVALGQAKSKIDEGIQELSRQLRTPLFDNYVKIIATTFDGQTRRKLGSIVDGLVDKTLLYERDGGSLPFLEDAFAKALSSWSKRTGRPNPVTKRTSLFKRVDGPSMRRVEASVGAAVIDRI